MLAIQLRRTTVKLFISVAIVLFVLMSMSACKAGQVRKNINKTEAAVETTLEYQQRVNELLALAAAGKLQDGELYQTLYPLLPPEYALQLKEAFEKGQSVAKRAEEVSAALGVAAQRLLDRLESLKADLEDAKDEDDVTFQVAMSILAAIFGGTAAGIPALRIGKQRGVVEGATTVTRLVASGRSIDPSLDAAFNSGPGATVMKRKLSMLPTDVRDAVMSNKNPVV
jgi:hypothetical protein